MSDMQNQQDPKALIKKVLAPIAEDMAAVDAVIRSELASDVPRMKEISEYITSAGGKRMRPALLMLICRALGYEGTLHQYLGATIELLHTATLMHDDVVDESDMRRGRPTANSRWGNGAAVLVGDFLYTRSFQMMVKAGNLRVMEALSDAANRLSEGEVVQMVNAHDPSVDETRYFRVIERKTACLFEAGARMAAAIADCGPEKEEAVAEYALALGNAFQIADDVQFEVVGISDIRETDDYPGIRVALKANYPPISVPLTVDVTTGDMITPREVEYTFSLLFDDRTISILAYNLETVLAEKLETVLSRNIANTRPRDYYDVHILYALRGAECDKATLRRALERTTQKRGSGTILTDYPEIMKEIRESDTLRRLWEKYSREYEYAKDISFDDTCNTIQTIMDAIMV